MYFEAVFRFYVLLNHFVGHFFFGLVRFGSFSNTIYRNLALALSKLHINVDITVGFFVGQKNYRLNNRYTAELDYAYMVGFQTAFRMMLLGITDPELIMSKIQPTTDS